MRKVHLARGRDAISRRWHVNTPLVSGGPCCTLLVENASGGVHKVVLLWEVPGCRIHDPLNKKRAEPRPQALLCDHGKHNALFTPLSTRRSSVQRSIAFVASFSHFSCFLAEMVEAYTRPQLVAGEQQGPVCVSCVGMCRSGLDGYFCSRAECGQW